MEPDFAGTRPVICVKDSCFSCAVCADECDYLALVYFKGNALDSIDNAVKYFKIFDSEQ